MGSGVGMARRLTFEEVYDFFKQHECKLLEDNYINSNTRLRFKCKCGNVEETTFQSYKNSRNKKCRACGIKIGSGKQKLCIDDIRAYYKEQNCELLEGNYINSTTKMEYRCSCGNLDCKTWDHFRSGQRCKDCAREKKKNKLKFKYDEVELIYKEQGCVLLEKLYENNHQKLKFKCHCGKIEEDLTLKQFKSYKQCKDCCNILYYNKNKVIDIFKSNNCTLIIDDYINNQQKVEYICPCGNIEETTIHNFIHSIYKRCKQCTYEIVGENIALDFEFVKSYFEDQGCKLLSTEYIKNSIPLDYICSCGNISKITFNSFQNGRRCIKCAIKRGSESPRWNPNLTDEERERKRQYTEYGEWRSEVYKRDDYTCQCCGDNKGGNLIAHHLDGWDWNKIDRFNVDNGITLCEICHSDFHNMYGYGGNTKDQYEEYIIELYEGIVV